MMTESWDKLRIDPERMRAAFEALARIGASPGGGVNRPALSEAHLAARRWFREQIETAGLKFRTDGAGNHSAFLACGPAGAPTLLLGSHLDSVPDGGRFDGALGVMAAFEVLRTVQGAGLRLPVNLEAIDFTDEEGTLVGLLGSAALAGGLSAGLLESPRGGRAALLEGLGGGGLSEHGLLQAVRPAGSLAGYIELHIEQGRRLERAGAKIGIISAIVGISSYRLTFLGRADHAGTTGMEDRLDAAQGASAFTLAARELVLKDFPDCVVNVGRMELAPGAFNIVPASADLALEFRAPTAAKLQELDGGLLGCAHTSAARFGLDLRTESLGKHLPTPMDPQVQSLIAGACEALGLAHIPLVSGAGHDGQSLAHLSPVGMIFVPSVDGASHAAREFTHWEDCVDGADVLLQAALRFAESQGSDQAGA
jgi:N-carbamoyl-L-amino-acid hydrolase